ncbi:MAG: CHAD domain-containing protein [Nautiliaceae bacterium]
MEKLIRKYLKKDDPEVLHDLRVWARRQLSILEKEGKTDKGLKKLLKKSSNLRDTDVLSEICKNKKVKKYLRKKHKKLRKKLLKFLKKFKRNIVLLERKKEFNCEEIFNTSFIGKDDKTLHKLRIIVKKCRYTNPELEEKLKKIQDYLGKAHDYYNCERLLIKFGKNPEKAIKKKMKYIRKAEKVRFTLSD